MRSRGWFYLGLAALIVFERANVWFIMPLPYSQRMRSIDAAYFLYSWRWAFRAACAVAIAVGARAAFAPRSWRKLAPTLATVIAAGVAYMANFVMAADRMFLAPASVDMQPAAANRVEPERLVVGVALRGEARAYPVQFIGYHHQVRDSIAGEPLLVTFCTVCRTGRVFSPVVDGRVESFRLVGMDHFNAMFEDATTGSWWRQVSGEAVAGRLTGDSLREIPSQQVTLRQWLAMYPNALVMQADETLRAKYSQTYDSERGTSRSALTGTDTASWHDKSWVVGVSVGAAAKAYDWNRLRREGAINDDVAGTPIVVAIANDGASYFAYARPDSSPFALRGDSLVSPTRAYAVSGTGPSGALVPVQASQEFWHSWRTFHPRTARE